MAVKDNYWESPYYNPEAYGMTHVPGQGRTYKETPYGTSVNDLDLSYMFNGSNSQGGAFDQLKNWFGGAKNKFFAPGTGGRFGNFINNLSSPQFNWSSSSGLQGWGKNLGGYARFGTAALHGYNAIKGMEKMSDLRDTSDDISSDIVSASYNNPMLHYDLTSDQMKLLRDLRNDRYDGEVGFNDINKTDVLTEALKGGAMGIVGGLPGMVLGAVGSGANAVINGMNEAQSDKIDELEALYQAIMESEQQYNALKKQRAYANLAGY